MRPVDIAKQITTRRRSAGTEVHWVPRANENGAGLEQQHAVTSRELGERDWAAIDPVQVRTSKGVRHYQRADRLHLVEEIPEGLPL